MSTVIIVVLLVVICVFSVKSYMKKLSSGCCGGGDKDSVRKVKVNDRNKAHYPYQVTLTVDGMVCGNCAKRVENALNTLDGVWATVDLGKKEALVRLKEQLPEARLRDAVREAGYTVMKVENV